MGPIKSAVLILLIFITLEYDTCLGGWTGPTEVVLGSWGTTTGKFAISYQDTQDIFPTTIAISSTGRIAISEDQTIKRVQIFLKGTFERSIDTFAFDLVYGLNDDLFVSGGGFRKYDSTGKLQWSKTDVSFDELYSTIDGIIVGHDNHKKTYYLYSPTGQIIKTSATRPLELGLAQRGSAKSSGYLQSIKYPNTTFNFIIPWETLKSHHLDNNGNLIITAQTDSKDAVYMINPCGQILGQMQIPKDKGHIIQQLGAEPVGELDYEYGNPLIDANGNVFTWKRTPDKYRILKWTWLEAQTDYKKNCSAPDTGK